MTGWVAGGNEPSGTTRSQKVAEEHVGFERIHSFTRENGRVGRLLANWGLVHADDPPKVIRIQQRERYLRQLALSGRLRAVRHGSLWLSSQAALLEYMDSRSPALGGNPRVLENEK